MGLLALSLWMLWPQLLWSLYNSQISETLDSKQTVPSHSLPMPGTAEGRCLCSWNSFLEATSTYHWSLPRATSPLPITCWSGRSLTQPAADHLSASNEDSRGLQTPQGSLNPPYHIDTVPQGIWLSRSSKPLQVSSLACPSSCHSSHLAVKYYRGTHSIVISIPAGLCLSFSVWVYMGVWHN